MTQDAAATRAEDRHQWHLKYWLNLYVLGIIHHHDEEVMAARIDRERNQNILKFTADPDPNNIYISPEAWNTFKNDNEAEYFRYWKAKTPEYEEYQAYVRDLERMHENKDEKMIEYLRLGISVARRFVGSLKEESDNWFKRMYLALEKERIRDAQEKAANEKHGEACNQGSNGTDSEHK